MVHHRFLVYFKNFSKYNKITRIQPNMAEDAKLDQDGWTSSRINNPSLFKLISKHTNCIVYIFYWSHVHTDVLSFIKKTVTPYIIIYLISLNISNNM